MGAAGGKDGLAVIPGVVKKPKISFATLRMTTKGKKTLQNQAVFVKTRP